MRKALLAMAIVGSRGHWRDKISATWIVQHSYPASRQRRKQKRNVIAGIGETLLDLQAYFQESNFRFARNPSNRWRRHSGQRTQGISLPICLSIIEPDGGRARSRFVGRPARLRSTRRVAVWLDSRVPGTPAQSSVSSDLLMCARHVVVPVHKWALGIVAPRPDVQFEERR